MFQNGGLPAKPFATKAKMTTEGASLADGQLAQVYNETANNGLYVKTAGAWVKATYDPLVQAKNYTDTAKTEAIAAAASDTTAAANAAQTAAINTAATYTNSKDLILKTNAGLLVDVSNLTSYDRYANPLSNSWLKTAPYTGYFIEVKAGDTYKVTAKSNAVAAAYALTGNLTNIAAITGVLDTARLLNIGVGETKSITIQGTENLLWVSGMFSGEDRKPSEVSRVAPFLLKNSVANNLYTAQKNEVVGGVAVRGLTLEVDNLKSYITDGFGDKDFKKLDITGEVGVFSEYTHTLFRYQDLAPNANRMVLPLAVGDVLEFSYRPTMGATLIQHIDDARGYTLLGQVKSDKSITRYYKHTVLESGNYSIVDYLAGSVLVNGSSVAANTATILTDNPRLEGRGLAALREVAEWLIYKSSAPIKVARGDKIRIVGAVKGEVAIWASPNQPNPNQPVGWWFSALSVPLNYPSNTIEWTAPEAMTIILQSYATASYYLKKSPNLRHALLDNRKPIDASTLGKIDVPEKETVFATHLSFILKMEMVDGVENIAISQNLGKTWTYIPNIIGSIVNYHFFTDGTIMLCSEKEIYWTDDYLTLNQTTILNNDGTPWVRERELAHNFFGQQNGDKPMFVDDQEIYVWGEYVIGSTTPGMWYSIDNGRTVKRVTDFQGVVLDGEAVDVRHIHKVYYHAKKQDFYVMTGDSPTEVMLIKANYNVTADTWSWEILGSGEKYKFGNMWCDDYYAYFTTDYTDPAFWNYWGIVRVGLNHLNDPSKFRLAYDAANGGWGAGSPYRMIADRNGNKVLFGELVSTGFIMVATQGWDFKRVELNPRYTFSFIIGPNDNGDIYMKADFLARGLGTNAGQFLTGGTVNITKMLRNAGLVNFMTGEQNIPHLPYTSE